jgi:anti-sigma regulatory factor (Ser/Thr protein kinase)
VYAINGIGNATASKRNFRARRTESPMSIRACTHMSGCSSVVREDAAVTAQGSRADCRPVLRMTALDLPPLADAVPSARLHARHVACEWGHAALAESCEIVVSELVTNAIEECHRLPAATVPLPVRLRLTARPYGIQVEVWDASENLPDPRRDRPADEPGGWGLVLVAALASRWGTYRTKGGGKVTWAVVGKPGPTPPRGQASAQAT